VPLEDDILKVEPPRDRVERLKRILKTIDYNREGVKENLMYMFEREKRRIIEEATATEAIQGQPKIRPGLPTEEVDTIISSMEAEAQSGMDYNIQDIPQLDTQRPIPPDMPLRDRTVIQLLNLIENGLVELRNYEGHMAGIADYYTKCLERELAIINEAGMRPEERASARGF
jgi:hypothetical protein